MKFLKMLSLAALAALMAMAFAGPPSAMAESTALCSLDPGESENEVCPLSSLISHVHETSLSGTKAKLKTGSFTVECDVLFLGDVNPGFLLAAMTLKIFGNFTYTNCDSGCTVTEENEFGVILVLRESHDTAVVTYELQVHVECGKIIDCKYKGTGLVGTARGLLLSTEANGEVAVTEQELSGEGVLCPKIARLNITTTPLLATFIAK